VHGTPDSRNKCRQDDYFSSHVVTASEFFVIDADGVEGIGKGSMCETSEEVAEMVGVGREEEGVDTVLSTVGEFNHRPDGEGSR
jgi:hypothetical protein